MKIGFGSDHAAIELKNCLLEHMKERGFECVDFGAFHPEEKVDYPVPGRAVAEAIRAGEIDKGVLVCGTGVGISLAANKVPGIRAGVCSEPYTARMIAEHNNCQIVAMGARVVGTELGKMICDAFFDAQFLGGRHARRVDLITQIESDYHAQP
ncbi:MAG: ribose 5-phosphate isomerase B [Lawsonibacter sp.]|nr:ribose 5-phosphate isomerase B [Lawsonibacter sp.]